MRLEAILNNIGFVTGHDIHAERVPHLVNAITQTHWTVAEVELAQALITTDVDLLRIVGYERTVGPRVFAEAKQRIEVARGRLMRYPEARAFARKAWPKKDVGQVISTQFDVVRVESQTEPSGALTAFWHLKPAT
ncbi:MAG: hypothetical protein RhofKO_29260 [Rhodothermales bacterium]